jgi:thiosulfate dehydrogenase (quinone) large subunit
MFPNDDGVTRRLEAASCMAQSYRIPALWTYPPRSVVQSLPGIRARTLRHSLGYLMMFPRVWLGWQWLQAGLEKVSNPAWASGEPLRGFWLHAVAMPAGERPPIAFDWYRAFIQALLDSYAWPWFAGVVASGELFVGLALLLGLFTPVAAGTGALMNWNYMMAGSASTNPVLFPLALAVLLTGRKAGALGADGLLRRVHARSRRGHPAVVRPGRST